MRPRLVELLACPACGGPLTLSTSVVDGDEIIEGTLACEADKIGYPIVGGIPRLMPDADRIGSDAQRTVDRFGQQWNDFDFIEDHYEQQFLGWIGPNQPATFDGQLVLEGGCGKGRHSALVAKWGAKDVLAVDLGSAVEAAYRNTRRFENVHVIQADLFHLPVRRDTVDVAFSVGVLHHTPDPRAAFMELVRRVRVGGKMIAWIYGRENNEWIVDYVDPVRKGITSRLPHRWVYQLSKVPAAMVWAAGKGVYRPLRNPPFDAVGKRLFYQAYINVIAQFPFDEIHSIVHDHFTPPIANYIPRDEFEQWWRDAGLADVTISWHNENSWRGTGVRSPRVEAVTGNGAEDRV